MQHEAPISADLVIESAWVIPVEPPGIVLENYAVAVSAGKVVALLPRDEMRRVCAPAQTCTLNTHILIPGLINLHTHAAMALMRGLADDIKLMNWLSDHIWPAESKHVSEQFVHDGTLLACAEMLRGGITCFNDM